MTGFQQPGPLTGGPLGLLPRQVIKGKTLTQLQAMGTSQGITTGRLAVDPETGLLIQAAPTPTATTSVWTTKRRRTVNPHPSDIGDATADLLFCGFGTNELLALVDDAGATFLCRWPTRILSALLSIENDPGDVELSIWESAGAMPLETVVRTVPADTPTLFEFTALSSVAAGSFLSIGEDPTLARTAGQRGLLTVEIEETVTL